MFKVLKECEKSLSEQVADQIVQMITDHNMDAGEKLPNEFEIANRLKVGRGTVREAVKLLVSRNVLEICRGKGTFVTSNPGVLADPFGLAFQKDQYKLTSDLIEIRLILEPEIAALAAARAEKVEIYRMQELCDKIMALASKDEDYIHFDTELHVTIARSTGNLIMPNIVPVINKGIFLYNTTLPGYSERTDALNVHEEIVQAISRRDESGAKDAMTKHLLYNKRNLEYLNDKYTK